ncbi:MAG: M56 family metallopeptidase [Sulfitobacter sp.]
MTANAFFHLYLDANILLLLAAVLWGLTRFLLNRTGLRQAFSTQLQMIYGALITVAVAPLIIVAFALARQHGLIGSGYSVSFSDFAVSQYLNGHITMAPSRFETLLAARDLFTVDVTTLASPMGQAIAATLMAGFAYYTLKMLRNGLIVEGIVRRSYVWRKAGRVEIRLTDQSLVPFSTRGLRQHYIIIPSGFLSQADDLRIAIAHELQHTRQHDLLWEVVIEILRPLFFWNPAFGFWKRQVENLRELACDQQVLARRGIGVRDYCDCLLRVCRNSLRKDGLNQLLVPSVPFAHVDGGRSAKFLKYRVLSILDGAPRAPGKMVTLGLFAPLAIAIAFGSVAAQQTNDWSQDRLMLSAIVNLERLDALNGIGR